MNSTSILDRNPTQYNDDDDDDDDDDSILLLMMMVFGTVFVSTIILLGWQCHRWTRIRRQQRRKQRTGTSSSSLETIQDIEELRKMMRQANDQTLQAMNTDIIELKRQQAQIKQESVGLQQLVTLVQTEKRQVSLSSSSPTKGNHRVDQYKHLNVNKKDE